MTDSTATSRILTLVFTDLEGSTALKVRRGDLPVGELIAQHRAQVQRLASEAVGRVIDWAGDGCFLTFETPSAAVRFALGLQQTHLNASELPGVRVGMHMGEVSERPGPDGDATRPRIEGLAVDLAARLRTLAQPMQIPMSTGVADSARQRLQGDVVAQAIRWQRHGGYALKGFATPIEVCEVSLESTPPVPAPASNIAARVGDGNERVEGSHRRIGADDKPVETGNTPAAPNARAGQHPPHRFRLGDRLITPSTNEIDGVRVETKAMEVLVALTDAAPGVLSAAALLDRVWPNVVVVDNVVHQSIAILRKALGDDARSARYIESIPRRGYRLVAEIIDDSAGAGTERSERIDSTGSVSAPA